MADARKNCARRSLSWLKRMLGLWITAGWELGSQGQCDFCVIPIARVPKPAKQAGVTIRSLLCRVCRHRLLDQTCGSIVDRLGQQHLSKRTLTLPYHGANGRQRGNNCAKATQMAPSQVSVSKRGGDAGLLHCAEAPLIQYVANSTNTRLRNATICCVPTRT